MRQNLAFAVEQEASSTSAVADDLRPARVITFDSGLGGLTVLAEIARALPQADLLFAADDAAFPYGRLTEAAVVARVLDVMAVLIGLHRPDVVVIACNTASTVVLTPLRARWPDIRFVGTVPAIKPAAALSRTKLISILATPGTVSREYTHELIRQFAADCSVTLVGSPGLAGLAEAAMRGETVEDAAIAAEIRPAFVQTEAGRTDAVVLACTHYPLLLGRFEALVPWPVAWIDPAPAIARRVVDVLRDLIDGSGLPEPTGRSPIPALFTSGRHPGPDFDAFLSGRGLTWQASPTMVM